MRIRGSRRIATDEGQRMIASFIIKKTMLGLDHQKDDDDRQFVRPRQQDSRQRR